MLVLARKKGESIMIGDSIELVILETEGETVRIGIKAPKNIAVFRKEIYQLIRESNQEASKAVLNHSELNKLFKNKQ